MIRFWGKLGIAMMVALACAAVPPARAAMNNGAGRAKLDTTQGGGGVGALRWKVALGGKLGTPVIGPNGNIFISSFNRNDERLYAIGPDGMRRWTFTASGEFTNPAVGSSGTVYVGVDDKLIAINPVGRNKWVFHLSAGEFSSRNSFGPYNISSPIVSADGTIYIAPLNGQLIAVNPDGTRRWISRIGDWDHSSPALGPNGTIYVEGVQHWDANLPKWWNPLTWNKKANCECGVLKITTFSHLFAVNPNGAQKWKFTTGTHKLEIPPYPPAVSADGTVFVSSEERLYATEPAEP